MRSDAWAFGQSETRNDEIWKRGVDARYVTGIKRPSVKDRKDSADTAGGIDRALTEAEKNNIKSSLGMSFANESSAWKVTPDQKKLHPDENIYRDRRHVVRAFADVKASEDLNISVGPELILKDEQHVSETANESQPDSALGLGMRFKYDF